MSPRVSVIVPLFNSRATIGETLASLLAQTLCEWEAIVVDDGSTDDGPSIARAFAERDARVRVVHQVNRGLAGARNTGIGAARGEYLHFLDADDTLGPRALDRLVCIAALSDGRAAACGWECVDAAGEPLRWVAVPPTGSFGLEELLESNRAVVHAMVISRERLADLRFDESLPVLEDYDLWLRLAARGVRWVTTPEPLATYRLRPDSMSRATRVMWETTRRVLTRAHVAAGSEPSRRDAALSRQALTHAALLAARDPAGAAAIISQAPDDSWMTPIEVARTLHGCLPSGLGLPPGAWGGHRSETLFGAAREWVSSAIPAVADRVFDELAALTVDATAVARVLTARLSPEERVTLVGAGRNGRIVAEALAHRSVPFEVFDDDPAAASGLAGAFAVTVSSDISVRGRSGAVILTPGDDAALLARVGSGREVRRWATVAREMGRSARARLGDRRAVRAA